MVYFWILVKQGVMLENPQSSPVDILEVQSGDICDQMWLISPHGEYCGYTPKKCEKCGFYTNFSPFFFGKKQNFSHCSKHFGYKEGITV